MLPVPSPFRRPRKEDDDPFGDLFANFDREFRRMQEYMNDIFEQALRSADIPKGDTKPGNPFVYGFTMRLGPDGRPRIEQFGNVPHPLPGVRPEVTAEGREPITDLIEHDDHFSITVELPGVEKDDVHVFATPQQLTIKVDTAARKYYKEVDFRAQVLPDSTEATFKNGVLDVTMKKQRERKPDPGHRVSVK